MNLEIRLTSGRSRALALALALLPVAAAILLTVDLVSSWSGHHATMARLATERDAYRGGVSEAPALGAAFAKLQASKRSSDYFFSSGETAAAKIRSDIGAIIARDGGTVARDDVELVTAGDDSPVELRASVSFAGDIKSLTRILYHLRQAKPLLLVTQLEVHGEAGSATLSAPNRLQADFVAVAILDTP